MLTKSDLDQNQNLRLSAPGSSKEPSVIERLETTIAAVRDKSVPQAEVTILVLQVLQELLRRTAPPTGTIPLMTGFDPYPDDDHFAWAKNDAELHK